MKFRTVITGTGSYIPTVVKKNKDFTAHDFFDENKNRMELDPTVVVEKFKKITGIEERRYISEDLNTSDIGTFAVQEAIKDSGVDIETLDQIIVAHNFGNVI